MAEKNKSQKLVLLDPLAYAVADAALVCGVGITGIRDAIRLGELVYVAKGNGDNREHRVILRSDLEAWLVARRRTKPNKNNFPKSATRAD